MVGNPTITNEEKDVHVVPELRIVPCGGSRERLKATVLFSPLPVDAGKGSVVLNRWPVSMAELLDDSAWTFDIRLQPIKRTATTTLSIPCPDPASVPSLTHRPLAAVKAFESVARRGELNLLWQKSIARSDGSAGAKPWMTLKKRLLDSSKAEMTLGSIADQSSVDVLVNESNLGAQGQLNANSGNGGTIHSVISIPHADLAVALDQKRAAELLASMTAVSDRKPEVSGQRPMEPLDWDALAAQYGLPASPEELTPEQKRQLHDNAVKAYRIERLNSLQEEVQKSRKIAQDLYTESIDALRATECPAPTGPRSGCTGCAPADVTDESVREAFIAKSDAVEEHATWPQHANSAPEEVQSDYDGASQAFHTFQSTPSLARAFLLAVDVEFDAPKDLPDGMNYAYLSISLKGAAQTEQLVTLCKVEWRKNDAGKGFWHFWPTTMAELQAWLRTDDTLCGEALTQHDAVMVMSGGWDLDFKKALPRFDISCLDLNAALTSNRQRRLAIKDSEPDRQNGDENEIALQPWSDLDTGATLTSAGLTLLQRSAQADVIAKLAARKVKSAGRACGAAVTLCDDGCTRVVLDAEDLTIGTRLVVGRKRDTTATDWRPLMGRIVTFGTTPMDGSGKVVEEVLADLLGKPGSPARIALDSAFTTMGNRVLPLKEGLNEIIVDEAYATWDGGPMGVDCATRDDLEDVVEDALAFGRELSLPDRGEDRPHVLRYGHPYRMAMLPVYSGGASLPMAEFPADTTEACGADPLIALLYYPPSCGRGGSSDTVSPYVRMLRHARIAPPAVLLPSGHATKVNGPVGTEAARDLVVRSLATDDEGSKSRRLNARAQPDLAQRLVLVPTLSQDEAARHGMLDRQTGLTKPRGAYANVVQNSEKQCFPVTVSRFQKGIAGRKHFLDIRIEGDAPGLTSADGQTFGDAVWRQRSTEGPSSYFPDPAARYLAVRLRVPGREGDHAVRSYDLWRNGKPEVQPHPVLLTLSKAGRNKPPGLPNSGGLSLRSIVPGRVGDVRGGGNQRVFDLEIVLAKGEVFDLDLWFVPDGQAFARDFALPQALGVHLAACARRDFASKAVDICATLGVKGLSGLSAAIKADLSASTKKTDIAYVAPGGVAAPSNETLKSIGRVVAGLHRARPLPEVSCVQRLTLTHAVNRLEVKDAPTVHEAIGIDPFPNTISEMPAVDGRTPIPLYARRHSPGRIVTIPKALSVAEMDGETGLVLGGTVSINLDLADSIEVWGRMIQPDSHLFDDASLGRSPALRQSGTWPTRLSGEESGAFRKARSIFGFRVAPDGRVTHDRRDVLLLRIDDLRRTDLGGLEQLDLMHYFLQPKDYPLPGRVVRRYVFTDGKARVMEVWVNALCRTSELLVTVDRVAFGNDPWIDPSRSFGFILGDLVESAPLAAGELERKSNVVKVVMPASIRPTACDARSPFPVFSKSPETKKDQGSPTHIFVERKAMVRIPLGRGWFSSGEDERVGFVLWPPRLLGKRNPAGTAPIEGRGDVLLDGFRDTDLGPGGRFVSRRGGDPVRAGFGEERELFLRGEDFLDLALPGSDWRYEDEVLMPLAKPAETGATAAEFAGHIVSLPPMRVALVTVPPRFDPEREEWYVDLSVSPSAVPEAFVRLGLVRYQPHTDPDRRCSLPVVQWTQPLPDRLLDVRPGNNGGLIVQITGTAPSRQTDGPAAEKQGIVSNRQPRMRVTLFAETRDSDGRLLRREVSTTIVALDAKAKPIGRGDRWQWTTQLDSEKLKNAARPNRDGSLPEVVLFVEEIEAFLPAEHAKEPISPGESVTTGPSAETGPRYSQRILLQPMLNLIGFTQKVTGVV